MPKKQTYNNYKKVTYVLIVLLIAFLICSNGILYVRTTQLQNHINELNSYTIVVITGIVNDPYLSQPVENASVFAYVDLEHKQTATTDSIGQYILFLELRNNEKYRLRAYKEGYIGDFSVEYNVKSEYHHWNHQIVNLNLFRLADITINITSSLRVE